MTQVVTKDKGDIGVASIISDLTKKNIKIALPISEHLPFDIIAIRQDGKLSRISVKYLSKDSAGTLQLPLRTISSNSQGYKVKYVDLSVVDAFAIYCPDTDKCYYVNHEILKNISNSLSLRIDSPSSQKNSTRINWAHDYENYEAIFG